MNFLLLEGILKEILARSIYANSCSPVRLFVFAYWTQHFVRFLKLKFNVKVLDKTNRPKVISIPIGWLSLIEINWVGLNDKRVTTTKKSVLESGRSF